MSEILIDETFDINDYQNYNLSIQIFLDGFSFSVIDLSRSKIIAFEHFSSISIQEALDKSAFSKMKFKKVNIIVSSPSFTLIPSDIFTEESMDAMYNLSYTLNSNEQLYYNNLNKEAVVVFALDKHIESCIKYHFTAVSIFHSSNILVAQLFNRAKKDTPEIQVSVYKSYIIVAVSDNDSLKLVSSYNYTDKLDIVYSILNIISQLNLLRSVEVILGGDFDPSEEFIATLQEYASTSLSKVDSNTKFSYKIANLPMHNHAVIFNSFKCV